MKAMTFKELKLNLALYDTNTLRFRPMGSGKFEMLSVSRTGSVLRLGVIKVSKDYFEAAHAAKLESA